MSSGPTMSGCNVHDRTGVAGQSERDGSRGIAPKPRNGVNRGGRPTLYTAELVDDLVETFATTTMGLDRMCEETERFPCADTVRNWMRRYPVFRDAIASARARKVERLIYSALDDLEAVRGATGGDMAPAVKAAKHLADFKLRLAQALEPLCYGSRAAVDVHGHHHDHRDLQLTEDAIRRLQQLAEPQDER